MPPGVAPTGVTVGTGPPGRKVAATKQASLTAPGGSKLQAADPCVGVGVVNPSAPGGRTWPGRSETYDWTGPELRHQRINSYRGHGNPRRYRGNRGAWGSNRKSCRWRRLRRRPPDNPGNEVHLRPAVYRRNLSAERGHTAAGDHATRWDVQLRSLGSGPQRPLLGDRRQQQSPRRLARCATRRIRF